MLRSSKLDSDDVTRGLETIERNARLQSQLIEDLLDLSRIISGKLRLDVRRVELADVIEAAVDVVRPAAEAKNIRLQVILGTKIGPVSGDPDRLQQVFWNLLSNAIKFTPKGGRVQVHLERVNSHVEVSVSDTGQGISAEFLPFVFERFHQAHGKTKREGGLGLGMAITRQLVELHGGTINVFSPGEGQGSTFTVSLPLMILHNTAHLSRSASEQPAVADDLRMQFSELPSLDGIHVLVVDDESDARELMTMVLTQAGATVSAVGNVSEALEKLHLERPDLLVSDIEMPGEDGYSLIRKIRSSEQPHVKRIPAVALTAQARPSDRMQVLSAGYQIFLTKPVEPSELVVVIANLIL
jgi:CheY-like chemotaxis protein